ncbi:3-keto-5-aminohexanoate cleavage protein [Pigmentiphaga sp.]|uniref:3-keto-5-aminohexanoate cleavage protein n=1 Tax=Pigmentiphaga sp. TaxID=1977564 RepID=UPI00128DEC2A|nr:3-keto-5-aminohexanoate cleavage protein [Pigmentiphaga sp.]MPS27276.1 3-keto-5-aminohexanoate cleavage protein [Alcaligenaceae bacterium SAGV5]MPS51580.1 3-keto-5-aminohexanoate cleavage protein [Alcaligenaceae bacterium SAGV3]MPT59000.1 3-keto-5-aminohexanoate cleavage protein [Alcaligenaceae bacterium]
MEKEVPNPILTCAITGGDDTAGRFPAVPVTPRQIAESAIEACRAGAAIAHIHVRDPATGKPSLDPALYREVAERVRDSGSPVILNLTTGAGARFLPDASSPNTAAPGSNLRPPAERCAHILELRPEICTLDMGSLNFGKGTLINVPDHIEAIAAVIREAGSKTELEIFDTGHIALARHLIDRGAIEPEPLWQLVLGVPWGAPANSETMMHLRGQLPPGARWAAFGIGRQEFPMLAQAALLGGHVRVGLEDNLYLSQGVQARSNAELVRRAVEILHALDMAPASPDEARRVIGLPPR